MNLTPVSRRAAGIGLGVLLLGGPPSGQAQQLGYSGGLQLASGDYGFQSSTGSLALFNGLDLSAGRFRAWLQVPFIIQSSPWVSFAGTGMVPSGGPYNGTVGGHMSGGGMMSGGTMTMPDSGEYAHASLGDPLAGASVEAVRESAARPSVRVMLALKAPLANPTRGFGTGAWDGSAGLSLTKSFGRIVVLASAAYWVLGDLPGLTLQDAVAYSAAVGRAFGSTGKVSALATFSGSTGIIPGRAGPRQVGAGVSYRVSQKRTIGALANIGLSPTAPDLSLLLTWQIRF